MTMHRGSLGLALVTLALLVPSAAAQKLDVIEVEGQPLGANVTRLLQALDILGTPLPADSAEPLRAAAKERDARKIQELLDGRVLLVCRINAEDKVQVTRGPGSAMLQQGGYTPVLIKIVNERGATKPLRLTSPQSGPLFSGGRAGNVAVEKGRFLQVETFASPPLTANLSGLKVEYAVGLIYSAEAGKRDATIGLDVAGSQAQTPISFDIRPGIPVKLGIRDYDGKPTVARFTFRDKAGHVYPPQAKRLAPDFFFQEQIYRADGDTVLLPPGEFSMDFGRGPEYHLSRRQVTVPAKGEASIRVELARWINTAEHGFYSGDHHIHAAGCAHYTNPTEGVFARDMFLHVKGEGLNVGCNLTWGPCYDFQRQFFEPTINKISEPFTVLKYDIEVSGFGSQALGHVCLLNLRDQTYPGSDGTKTKGWPTWTTPLMRWAKQQGAVTGYAHSASGLAVNPADAAKRLLSQLDINKDGKLSADEAARGLLPEAFADIDTDKDGSLSDTELTRSHDRVRTQLPNLAIPEMNGIGAQEICVTTAQKLCDFISAMDTQRTPEWNCWYHIMNCGFPLKVSGETDFPCVSGSRVGMGRVYVHLGKVERIDFATWCDGIAKGRAYVSDGYAHAVDFKVSDKAPGYGDVALDKPGTVTVRTKVAFAADTPLGTSNGGSIPPGKTRKVELIVNGLAVAARDVPADDKIHDLSFDVKLDRSSWVALRHYPQMHTNPVNVIVDARPIRASRKSALWCIGTIEQLWRVRGQGIAAHERDEAQKTFQKAIEVYRQIAAEAAEGS